MEEDLSIPRAIQANAERLIVLVVTTPLLSRRDNLAHSISAVVGPMGKSVSPCRLKHFSELDISHPTAISLQPMLLGKATRHTRGTGATAARSHLRSLMPEDFPLHRLLQLQADMLLLTLPQLRRDKDQDQVEKGGESVRATTRENHSPGAVVQAGVAGILTAGTPRRRSTKSSANASGCTTEVMRTPATGLPLPSGSLLRSCRGKASAVGVLRRSSSCTSRWSSRTRTTIGAYSKSLPEECTTECCRSPPSRD